MMERKLRLRLIQICLLLVGTIIIFITYYNSDKGLEKNLLTSNERKLSDQATKLSENNDFFYNIKYTGLDLSGNRYVLESEEATTNKSNQELVIMRVVKAVFYLKDNTVLTINSDRGIYNNQTLDMTFEENVKAVYEGSELFAQKAIYSNSKSLLNISNKVKIVDSRGEMIADKLSFDIKNQTLNISSFENGKINAVVN
jgi:LPS export ABC transporter protein LptC